MAANPMDKLFKKYIDVQYNEDAQANLTVMYAFISAYFVALIGIGVVAWMKKQRSLEASGDAPLVAPSPDMSGSKNWEGRTVTAVDLANAISASERVDGGSSTAHIKAHFTGSYHPVLIALTVFSTAFSGYTVVGVPQTTLDAGYIVLQFFAGCCSQSIAMLLFFPRLRRMAVARGYLSPTDFIADRYRSKLISVLCVIAACLPQVIYLAVQLASFGETVNSITAGWLNKLTGMIICVVFMVAMEFLGGMHAVVLTDVVQAILMLVGFILLFYVIVDEYSVFGLGSNERCSVLENATAKTWCLRPPSYNGTTFPSDNQQYKCLFGADPSKKLSLVSVAKIVAPTAPSSFIQLSYWWFVVNFFAFPLNPHLVQRIFLADEDRGIRSVTLLLIFAPFLAMGPGVLAGVVVASYYPLWGSTLGCGSAFGTLAFFVGQLGNFQYYLVTMLSCAALAAMMSSADSVILGVSNTVCIDIYRNMVNTDAPPNRVVWLGKIITLVMSVVALFLGMNISASTFLNWLTIQNGILFQVLPAVLFGMYTSVRRRAILTGLVVGIVVLIFTLYQSLFGSPAMVGLFSAIFAAPSFSAFVNILVVGLVSCCCCGEEAPVENSYDDILTKRFRTSQLTLPIINNLMSGTIEPNRLLTVLSLVVLPLTVPVFEWENTIGIMPYWAFAASVAIAVDALLVFMTALSWRTEEMTGVTAAAAGTEMVES